MRRALFPVALIALASLAGLVLALLADDRWNGLVAALLAPSVAVAIGTIALACRQRKERR